MKKLEYEPNLVFYLTKDGTYVPRTHYISWISGACEAEGGRHKYVETVEKIVDMQKQLVKCGLVTDIIEWRDISTQNLLKASQIEYAAPKVANFYNCDYEEAVVMCCDSLKKLAQSEKILQSIDLIDC